jgi:hypothetical protein
MSISDELMDALHAAVAPLPTDNGGIAIVLATADHPPAVSLLSAGDVAINVRTARLAVYSGSSAVVRLGGSCTLLVPSNGGALRVELQTARARKAGPIAVIEGEIVSVRPSLEPPWELRLDFIPIEDEKREAFLEYWRRVRTWLEEGALGEGPTPPGFASNS